MVLKYISEAVNEAGKFSIIVDETTDISTTEQVSICLRFVDSTGITRETFIGFHAVNSTTGEALFELICSVLNSSSLKLTSLVGQCYDGDSNMSGREKGVAARVREVSPRAVYVHCYGHRLNLALQDTLKDNECLRNALGVIQTLHNYFNTPKRESILSNVSVSDGSSYVKLKSQSETRWSCRWEAVKAVEQQPVRLLLALIELSDEKDPKTSIEAKGLVKAMLEFDFSLGLQVLKVIFSKHKCTIKIFTGAGYRYYGCYDHL